MHQLAKALIVVLAVLAIAGCASSTAQGMTDVTRAMAELDSYRNAEIQKILAEKGTRIYDLDEVAVHQAMLATMRNLGMAVEEQNAENGVILAKAPAPKPLNEIEWAEVQRIETPINKSFSESFSGPTFQDADYSVIVLAIATSSGSVEISLGVRVLWTNVKPGWVYPDTVPPTAVSMIVDKVWDEFEQVASIQAKTI